MVENTKSFDELYDSFANKIEQSKKSFRETYNRFKSINPKRILEIGFAFGATSKMWQHMLPEDGIVIAVDFGLAPHSGCVDWASGSPPIKLITEDSHSPSTILQVQHVVDELGSFDAIFIDGDHSYEGVKADYDNYVPMVRSGGMVAFHDHGHGPILKFWNELQVPGKVVLQDSLTIGIFQKV